MELVAFVINLDRRQDRAETFFANFENAHIPITRISAVDGETLDFILHSPLSQAEQGCWFSHLKVLSAFLSSGADYCLVFEDDAVPVGWACSGLEDMVAELIEIMQDQQIELLQLGHIRSLYRLRSRQGFTYGLMQFVSGSRSARVKVGGKSQRLHKNQFRAGTHAYIVSRFSALALEGSNTPALFGADDLLSAVAGANLNHRRPRLSFGSLSPGLFDQESRRFGGVVDSDV
jgi:GR25 family glycosyltransferase involved in LPS biosynthesis